MGCNPNLPCILSHQHLGCYPSGRWWTADLLCMHVPTQSHFVPWEMSNRALTGGRGACRLIILFPASTSAALSSIHRAHRHTSRKGWRAEKVKNCQGVAGSKSRLLSIALCGLLTGLRSQASVLMETLLWKDNVVARFLNDIHCYEMRVKEKHHQFGWKGVLWVAMDGWASVLVAYISQAACLRAWHSWSMADDYIQSMSGWSRSSSVKCLTLVLEDQSSLRHE